MTDPRGEQAPKEEAPTSLHSAASTSKRASYGELSNLSIRGANGCDFAYRDIGMGSVALVLLQHFRGNLDNWDPALVDELARDRRVISFDNVGVGGSSGSPADNFEQMAHDALVFIAALDLDQVDLLGFSIGSFVAQEVALVRPDLVRRLVLASSAPKGAADMHGWAPQVIGAVGRRQPAPEDILDVFYTTSAASRSAGTESLQRIYARTEDRDTPTTWEARQAQYDAVCTWGVPNHALLERLRAIELPVFVANGDSDPMIKPHYSYLLAGLLPQAQVKIYPDAAHGFLFQHHRKFATDVHAFLS
jgi:pimeloyl-ACP methyl ester carboxylesterase